MAEGEEPQAVSHFSSKIRPRNRFGIEQVLAAEAEVESPRIHCLQDRQHCSDAGQEAAAAAVAGVQVKTGQEESGVAVAVEAVYIRPGAAEAEAEIRYRLNT